MIDWWPRMTRTPMNDNIYEFVVLHDADTNDNIHNCVALHDANTNDHFHWHPQCLSAHGLRAQSHFPLVHSVTSFRTRTVVQVLSLSHHPNGHGHPSVALFFFLQYLKFVDNLCTAPNESMDSTDEFSFSTGYEPKAYDFKETSVEPYTRLLDSPPLFSDSLLRTPTTMTLHSRICSTKHIERKPFTLYQKTCLSVCRRRQCPIERGDPLEIERGDPLSNETRKHRLGLFSTNKKEQILAECQRQKKSTKIGWNCWFSTRRTSSRSSRRSSTTRSTASSRTIIAAKVGITWSSSEKSHWNGRVQEVSEFYIRHYCKTKICRGTENFLAEYRNCKMK